MHTTREQWFTTTGFARQEEISFSQCDCHQTARLSTLLKECAAMGGHHCDAKGLTYEVLRQQGHAFLLSRMSLSVHAIPVNGQLITIHTWEDGTKGPYFQRVFEWVDGQDTLLVSGRSDWVMVEPESHKICRPDAAIAQFRTNCPKEIQAPKCQKCVLPKEGLIPLGTHQVVWSDLDGNGHVHSGNYGDILWDYLPVDWQSRPLAQFQINYNKEAKLGDTIVVSGLATDETTFQIQGDTARGSCFTAWCSFNPR